MTRITDTADMECYLSDRLAQSDSLHMLTDSYTAPIYTDSWDHGVYTEANLNLDEEQRGLTTQVDRSFDEYTLGSYQDAAEWALKARHTLVRMDEWLGRMVVALHSIGRDVTKDEAYDSRALKKQAVRRRLRVGIYS